jgi:hypothetical protein
MDLMPMRGVRVIPMATAVSSRKRDAGGINGAMLARARSPSADQSAAQSVPRTRAISGSYWLPRLAASVEQCLHAALSMMATRSQYTIPPRIKERGHERALHFSHEQHPAARSSPVSCSITSQRLLLARATSSFPGAFSPAQIGEMDELLGERQPKRRSRDAVLNGGFQPPLPSTG